MAKEEGRKLGATDGKLCGWYRRGEQAETVGRTEISKLDPFSPDLYLVNRYLH